MKYLNDKNILLYLIPTFLSLLLPTYDLSNLIMNVIHNNINSNSNKI